MRHIGLTRLMIAVVGCIGAMPGSAGAVVQRIDGTSLARVDEILDGGAVINSDAAFEDLGETTGNLPLTTQARLIRQDPSTGTTGSANALATLGDARAAQTENPAEFGIDTVVFSMDSHVVHTGQSLATETREIVFTASEMGHPEGTPLQVTSYFYLDGFMVIWGELNTSPATTHSALTLRVTQTRSGQEPAVVLQTTLTLGHRSDGAAVLTGTGGLSADNVVLIDTFGTIPELGQAYIVIIPSMSIPYTYLANVGETFTLKAEVQGDAAEQPFTGAGVTLGLALDEFLALLSQAINEPVSGNLSLLTGSSTSPVAAKPLPVIRESKIEVLNQRSLSLPGLCGGLGMESLLLAVLWPGWCVISRRR